MWSWIEPFADRDEPLFSLRLKPTTKISPETCLSVARTRDFIEVEGMFLLQRCFNEPIDEPSARLLE